MLPLLSLLIGLLVGAIIMKLIGHKQEQESKYEIGDLNQRLAETHNKYQNLDQLKNEFVSVASHELRTPMTAIKGSLATILEGFTGPISPQAKEFLVAAYNENDRLIRLANNLLNISKIESGKLTFHIVPCDLDQLVRETINHFKISTQEKNLDVSYTPNPSLPKVLTDCDKIKEVLINLLDNAIKFTDQGGIQIQIHQEGNMLVTSIKDSGLGLTEEDQIQLFKKFSQVRDSYSKLTGGTGLGLYICKQIIEGLSGKIWLNSKIKEGSTFYFSLPITA